MIRVMTLLALRQLRNGIRTSLTDYRKLIPLIVILFFIGTQVLSAVLLAGHEPPRLQGGRSILQGQADTFRIAAFLILSIISIGIIDYGFAEGFLAFSLADVDYLFPSPVPRRLILAYRLAAKTALSFFQAALFFYFLIWRALETFIPGDATLTAGLVALLGLFFCLGGYASIAFALKLIFGFGRLATVRRWTMGILALAVLLLGYTYWQHGMVGLGRVTHNWLVIAVFYPCQLAAEALTAPLREGQSGVPAMAQLALFYVAATALLFSRKENFYEASLEGSERQARMVQAAKEQNWSAMFAIQAEKKKRRARPDGKEKPYTVPPFGRRGGALLWANMCAAAKRPFANFWGPLVGGVGVAVVGTTSLPEGFGAIVVGALVCYLLFILTMSGMQVFRQAVTRQPLVRPLPLPNWQVVVADVAPRVLFSCLFSWGAGIVLLFNPVRNSEVVAPLLLICIPSALVGLNLIQFMLAMWYPDAQDKLQQMLAGFVSLFLTMAVVSVMVMALLVPLLLRVPVGLAVLIFMIPSVLAAGILLYFASVVYARFQPKQ
jgi:hypothetical protein